MGSRDLAVLAGVAWWLDVVFMSVVSEICPSLDQNRQVSEVSQGIVNGGGGAGEA